MKAGTQSTAWKLRDTLHPSTCQESSPLLDPAAPPALTRDTDPECPELRGPGREMTKIQDTSIEIQHRSGLAPFPAGWHWADWQPQESCWAWGGGSLGMGRGNRIHTRFKLQSRVKQVSKVIKMLQSTTATMGKLCGNKTIFRGHFGCWVCKTFPYIPLRHTSPHQHIHTAKGCRPWVCRCPCCHQPCPGAGTSTPVSGRWPGGYRVPPEAATLGTPSTQLIQHCTAPTSVLGTGNCPAELTWAGINPPWGQRVWIRCCQLMAAGPGAAAAKATSKQHKGRGGCTQGLSSKAL